jgi:hypothetical protein
MVPRKYQRRFARQRVRRIGLWASLNPCLSMSIAAPTLMNGGKDRSAFGLIRDAYASGGKVRAHAPQPSRHQGLKVA